MRYTILLIVIAGLSACTPPSPPINTPSGKAEVCIKAKNQGIVSSSFASMLIDKGYSLSMQTDNMIKGDRNVEGLMAGIVFGSKYNSTPAQRIVYNIMETKDCYRVIADLNIVTNPNSPYEKLTSSNGYEFSIKIQTEMEVVKQQIEKDFKKERKVNSKGIK